MAFDISDRLNTQSLAFDFVKDVDGYKIVEVSYSASPRGFPESPGYWTRDLKWVDGPLRVEYFIIEDFIERIERWRG